jgi:hypothetical protein
MADVRSSQAGADGAVFGYLGVRIIGSEVWTAASGTPSRRLGPLAGAYAGVVEPRRPAVVTVLMQLLLFSYGPAHKVRVFVAFADGTRYERLLLPWAGDDSPKIAGQIGRFNAAAYLAAPPPWPDLSRWRS